MSQLYRQIKFHYNLGPASHLTHLDNLPAILNDGGIHCYNAMKGKKYTKLSNDDVQRGRAQVAVPCTGRPLHDYVPLYFAYKTPMVSRNRKNNDRMIFLRVSLNIFATPDIVFTDGNARTGTTQFFRYTGLSSLSVLNVRSIQTAKYAHDDEVKRQKQSEVLVPDFLPIGKVYDIFVNSDATKRSVVAELLQYGITLDVNVATNWYYPDTGP